MKAKDLFRIESEKSKLMLIIGHRGCSYDSGENIGGIISAIRAGVDGIEIDIHDQR